jgi:hypothetical protein
LIVASVRSAWFSFVVLLDLRFLVLDVERRDDALGEHAGAEAAGSATGDAAVEDQLHVIGTTEVEILADDFFEEAAARVGPVEDLRQRELGLEDRELIAIASGAVRGGEGMRESAQPLAEDRLDLGGVEAVGDPLHPGRRRTGADPIV